MTQNQVSIAELNTVLEQSAFLKNQGFVVVASEPGLCSLRIPFSQQLERPGGIVSGMTLMGAADVAMWLAIMSLRGTAERWVTSDMKTAFLRSARQEDLLCTAKILKPGKRSIYGTVETTGLNSGLIAHHVISYARVET